MIKRQLWELPFQSLHEALLTDSDEMLRANVSEDFQEGKRAFMEKRAPRLPVGRAGHMNLSESPEDQAFRQSIRAFLAEHLPTEIRDDVLAFKHSGREPYVRWHRILHAHGWGAPTWPSDYGGTGWNAVQRLDLRDRGTRPVHRAYYRSA